MPIPNPKNKEKKSEFVSRCMEELSKDDKFKTQEQKVAVCYDQWGKALKEAGGSVEFSGDEILIGGSYEAPDEYFGSEEELDELEAKEAAKKLNKPFRTPKGPKKFSVYVKNDKGNIVKVNFGDPNMEIKRDDPNRRKNFRARHNCDNPGPKWKARYWSCKFWSSKPVNALASEDESAEMELADLKEDLAEMIIGSLAAIKSNAESVLSAIKNPKIADNLSEPFLQQMAALAEDYVSTIHNYVMFNQEPDEEMEEVEAKKRRGLWDNIRDKKKRMGKNYKPAKPGSPDRPSKDSWKKAQE